VTLSTDDLYEKALGLSSNVDDNFLELARSLRQLLDRDPELFKKVIDKTNLGSRKAYYLVNISKVFDPLPVHKPRLRALGWTKLQVLVPHINEGNIEGMLELAENNTTTQLKALVKGETPPKDAHCVLMYFSPKDFKIFEEALVTHGGVRSGRGILNKEEALLRFIKAAQKQAPVA
jgi:hypothetical protein